MDDLTRHAISFCDTLEEHGHDGRFQNCKLLINRSFNNKKEIIDVLRKHPNWNEDEMCIIFEHQKNKRKFDKLAIVNFYVRAKLPEKVIESIQLLLPVEQSYLDRKKHKNIVDELNRRNPNYRIHYNEKLSKVILKICKEENVDFNSVFKSEYTILADKISESSIMVKEIISVNPVDFLTMSYGNAYHWRSCHNIDDGEYIAGTLSYMLDGNSFIYYQIPDNVPMKKIHTTSRILRQMWLYSDECLAGLRLYPQDNDNNSDDLYQKIRTRVLNTFSTCLEITDDNPWLISHKATMKYVKKEDYDSFAYPDWESYNPGSLHCQYAKLKTRKKPIKTLYGGNYAQCIICGNQITSQDSLYCDDCKE